MSRSGLGLVTCPILAGVERLWRNKTLVINGQQISPVFWMGPDGIDATAKTWTDRVTGQAFALVGGGADPEFDHYGPTEGPAGPAVKGVGANLLVCPSSSPGDIGTDDIFAIMIAKSPAATERIIWKGTGVTTAGWMFYAVNTGYYTFRIYSSVGNTAITSPLSPADQWYVITACVNRDEASTNGACVFANGYTGAGVDASAHSAQALDSTESLTLLGGGGAIPYNGTLAFAALYRAANLWPASAAGPVEMTAISRQVCSLIWGDTALHNHASLTPSTL